MIKCLVAGVALTIGLAGYAIAQETVHRHHHHMLQSGPPHDLQPGPSPDLQLGPSFDAINPSIYWSPAGGDPTHYAQTSGFYAGGH